MSKKELKAIDVVGDTVLSEEHTIGWKFCDFSNLEHKRGIKVDCKSLMCHGHSWSLDFYPRGSNQSSKDTEHVSIFLGLNFDDNMEKQKVNYNIRMGSHSRTKVAQVFTKSANGWGWKDFIKRADLLESGSNYLDDGNAMVEVDIQIHLDKTEPFHPKCTLSSDMLKMLESGRQTDVTFVIGKTKFNAHYNIIASRAPGLAELAEEYRVTGTEVPLGDDVDESVFQVFLRYAYAGEVPPAEMMKRSTRQLLDVADRFSCSNLKLLAESELVESGINVETAASLLLFADARSCALLKEATMNYIALNTATVMKTSGWAEVEKSASLMAEIVKASITKKSQGAGDKDDEMSVATLRRNLDQEGLSIDGTREMLVERLKSHYSAAKEHSTKRRRDES